MSVGYGTPLSQAALDALAATVPTPAINPPPGVSDASAIGNTQRYSMENHTHASKARKQRVLSVSTATYTWTYPTAFGAGVVPVCNGIAEDPTSSTVDSYNVQVSGAPTNTQCVFTIKRTTVALGVLGLNATPGTINLHLFALEP